MAKKVMEIVKEGKVFHKYKFYHHGNLQGWTITESPERICQLYGWRIEDSEFIPEPFSPWDYMNTGATPVREEIKEVK